MTTEKSDERTSNIDTCSIEEKIELIRYSYDKLYDDLTDNYEMFQKLSKIFNEEKLKADQSVIVISGCGTSGRQAHLAAYRLNRYLNKTRAVRYLIAGGEKALIHPVEQCEDDMVRGRNDLESLTLNSDIERHYIGISCGMSAAYIAGQLDYARQFFTTTTLIAFNKLEDGTNLFRDILRLGLNQINMINPNIGPEPITGSTRMKGATATHFILSLLPIINELQLSRTNPKDNRLIFDHLIEIYRKTMNDFFGLCKLDLIKIIEIATDTLTKSSSCVYVSQNDYGLMASMDASECMPTFGCRFSDFRAYFGYGQFPLTVSTDNDLTYDLHTFIEIFSPNVDDEFIIFIQDKYNYELDKAKRQLNHHADHHLTRSSILELPNYQVKLTELEIDGKLKKFFIDDVKLLSVKLLLNCLSTSAFVSCGKTYKNVMIDLRPTNKKLIRRAVNIIHNITDIPKVECQMKLEEIMKRNIKDKIVPLTILSLLQPKLSLEQHQSYLIQMKTVRKALEYILHNS
ncbi:hypothetical protein SNEBB_005129 [Seison nebaliae]|nr:hypothetical protein SNEBB_005129 [Seison nebaliae]